MNSGRHLWPLLISRVAPLCLSGVRSALTWISDPLMSSGDWPQDLQASFELQTFTLSQTPPQAQRSLYFTRRRPLHYFNLQLLQFLGRGSWKPSGTTHYANIDKHNDYPYLIETVIAAETTCCHRGALLSWSGCKRIKLNNRTIVVSVISAVASVVLSRNCAAVIKFVH